MYTTCARIDLDALASNLAAVRNLVGDRALLLALKADGYGHGAVPISRFVQEMGLADWLGVATVAEGVELRQDGVHLPILKLSTCLNGESDAAVAAGLSLTVTGEASIDAAEAAAARAGRTVGVHLKIDTGMNRLGCPPAVARGLATRIAACEHLDAEGIFTHLPASDTAEGEAFTRDELARFAAVVADIQDDRRAAGLPAVKHVHASNSGAILGHALDGLTMVRPGIMAYGYAPDAAHPASVPLRPVMSLVSHVLAVRIVRAGETVSYGRTWTAPRDTWVATVPIGYADGFSRLNSNRGRMLIGGRSYPVAGRVCMDQTMLDLGPAESPAPVAVGDEVVWLGAQGDARISAEEVAALMGTISHEVLCLVSARIPREYVPTGDVYQIGSDRPILPA